MPLTLLSKSLLLQERPDGETASLDLDTVLAAHKGVLIFGGTGFSSQAQDVRIDGSVLIATFSTKHGVRQASMDLEACGLIRNEGLVVPPALNDEALNIRDTSYIRIALSNGRVRRLPSLADLKQGKKAAKEPCWRDCNIVEAMCLHHLATVERLVLGHSCSKQEFSAPPRLLPGLLAGDNRRHKPNAFVDSRTGLVRDLAPHFVREAVSSRPRDWASVFETARDIVRDLVEPFRTSGLGLSHEVIHHLREAERHLSKSCSLRRAFKDLDSRRARRRARFAKRLQAVSDDLVRLLETVALLVKDDEPLPKPEDHCEQDDPFWG